MNRLARAQDHVRCLLGNSTGAVRIVRPDLTKTDDVWVRVIVGVADYRTMPAQLPRSEVSSDQVALADDLLPAVGSRVLARWLASAGGPNKLRVIAWPTA